MIKHVVFFQMKAEALGATGGENAKILAGKFKEISGVIPGVIAVELGMNINSENEFYDMCLYQTFESKAALQNYLVDPRHLAVKDFVISVVSHRVIVDYELP